MTRRLLPLALAVQMVFLSSGCALFRRKPKAPPQPPPAAAPAPKPRPAEAAMQVPKLPEPTVPVAKPEPQQAPPTPKVTVAEPPKPQQPKKSTRRTRSAQSGAKPLPTEPVPTQPATPAPRLGEVLSEGQRKEMLAQLDTNVAAVRQILSALSGRSLSREQTEAAARVRAFVEQAVGMKETDLSTAVELSRRALVLAQDLAGGG